MKRKSLFPCSTVKVIKPDIMPTECKQTNIDDLPDEILTIIFRFLNFHGHLRLSLVCRKWSILIENDILFMATVNFKVIQGADLKWDLQLMRNYKTVTFCSMPVYQNIFQQLTVIDLQLLENATFLIFNDSCYFRDPTELMSVLRCCNHLQELDLHNDIEIFKALDHMYSKPIKISICNPYCKSLVCFETVSHLVVYDWETFGEYLAPDIEFLNYYAPAITSMDIVVNFEEQLSKTENLELKSYYVVIDYSTDLSMLEIFFKKQKFYLTKLTITPPDELEPAFFNALYVLTNLTSINICLDYYLFPLNNLKPFKNLRSLSVNIWYYSQYEVDVSELEMLDKLKIRKMFGECQVVIKTPIKPLISLKKLVFINCVLDKNFYEQCATLSPMLDELDISFNEASENYTNSLNDTQIQVLELNHLIHLRSIKLHERIIGDHNELFSALRLPELEKCTYEIMSDNHLISILSQDTLDCLAKNCPKLLRILQIQNNQLHQIVIKRVNGSSKFRKTRLPPALFDYKVDYDSTESCSDDELGQMDLTYKM